MDLAHVCALSTSMGACLSTPRVGVRVVVRVRVRMKVRVRVRVRTRVRVMVRVWGDSGQVRVRLASPKV